MTLIETIDKIMGLRREADHEEEHCNYNPQDYTKKQVAKLREEADWLETELHKKIGWTG